MDAQNRLLVILGAGDSGVGAAILGKAKGWRVFVSDGAQIKQTYQQDLQANDISYESAQHTMSQILAADLVIKSPGIPEKAEVMKAIRQKGIQVISEIEFAGYYSPAKHICSTGSNGKTTTTMWCYHILLVFVFFALFHSLVKALDNSVKMKRVVPTLLVFNFIF